MSLDEPTAEPVEEPARDAQEGGQRESIEGAGSPSSEAPTTSAAILSRIKAISTKAARGAAILDAREVSYAASLAEPERERLRAELAVLVPGMGAWDRLVKREREEREEAERARQREEQEALTTGEERPLDRTIPERDSHTAIGHALVELLHERAGMRPIWDEGFYTYDKATGIWRLRDEDELDRLVQTFDGKRIAQNTRILVNDSTVRGALHRARANVSASGFFAKGRAGVGFRDGVVLVDAAGPQLQEHSPDHRIRAAYPFAWEGSRDAPLWDAAMAEYFRNDAPAERAAKETLLLEFAGICILGRATVYGQKALFLHGQGNDGKSSVARLLAALMPPGTTGTIRPQDWGKAYYAAKMIGIHLNYVGELPSRQIADGEAFKAVIVGDQISARHPAGRPFWFTPCAGHLFCTNTPVASSDLTDGFWRKVLPVEFTRRFRPDEVTPDHEKEIAQREAPALVRRALDAAANLIARRGYAVPEGSRDAHAEWRGADPLSEFLATACEPTDYKVGDGLDALYASYREYAEQAGVRPKNRYEFQAALSNAVGKARSTGSARRYPRRVLDAYRVTPGRRWSSGGSSHSGGLDARTGERADRGDSGEGDDSGGGGEGQWADDLPAPILEPRFM